MQRFGMAIQCAISCVIGCFAFWAFSPDPNPKVPLFAGLLFGFGGGWLVMFCYVWLRYGWNAARSMSMEP